MESLGLSNISSLREGDTLYFTYENSAYTWNDMDALGMVLAILSSTESQKNIVVTVKKSNIPIMSLSIERERYQQFLKTGVVQPNLLSFENLNQNIENQEVFTSNRFKPTLTLEPSFILVDGSEYGDMDYNIALQANFALPLAKGTTLSTRYNIPLFVTDNFKDGGIFDYRNRNKTTDIEMDQLLLSQYYQWNNSSIRSSNLLQVGRFDKELDGVSLESALSDKSGKHTVLLKVAHLEDKLYKKMDLYSDSENRNEKLLSYKYYWDRLNSDIKLTTGEFLYGDKGVELSIKRNFSDISCQFDIASTDHPLRGQNTIGKFTFSLPLGSRKKLNTKYIDIQAGDVTYTRRKTLVENHERSYAQPHHLKEIDTAFGLEKYYFDENRFHPQYIMQNIQRLRNLILEF